MKVTPRTKMHNQVDFSVLKPGNAFFWRGAIWLKVDDGDQGTVNLSSGEYQTNMCEEFVVPVDATVTWKRKEIKKKK